MSYTNTTSHYGLPQYVGSDKPKYLTDFNETMATIDGQMYDNATAAATADSKADAAQSTADANTSSISALDSQINGDSGLAADVAANQGAITTINSLIGNGTPTTTDKTIIGAINELNANEGDLTSLTTTEKTSIVGAINELNAGKVDSDVVSTCLQFKGTKSFRVDANSVKTWSELLDDVNADLKTYLATKDAGYRWNISMVIAASTYVGPKYNEMYNNTFNDAVVGIGVTLTPTNQTLSFIAAKASGSEVINNVNGTITDSSSLVPTSGAAILYINEFEVI